MFLLSLPDAATMKRFAAQYPEMDIDSTAACLRLLKVASCLLRELEGELNARGVSQARFLALIVLARSPDRKLMPVEIARIMGISKKNTARLLELMEGDGLVRRAAHVTDGRASTVTITLKGRTTLDTALPSYYRCLNKAMKPLEARVKRQLTDILATVELAGCKDDPPPPWAATTG